MKEDQERTPLRTILQNFLNHIESLDIQRIEDSYEKEFQELKFFSEILKTSKLYSCSEGEKEVNRKKNRYKDILPFDNSRVILSEYAGVPGSDYINANYIKGASGSPAYIACQGPLPHTVNDFWRMVVECEVQVIVMACNEEEAGKHKCENYWVEREGEEKQFGMVAIRLVKASMVCPDFLVRTMRLKYTSGQSPHVSEERTVCQFHYSAWPDHGVPPLVRPLLDMVRLVRDTQASETLPVLVHCSAGCGRTGTICAIDYVWGLLRAGKLSKDFSLYKLVKEMRKQRIAMVQTKEQYVLVHQAVRELFREQLRMIDSHPYENIDANGMPLVKEEREPMYASPVENFSEEKQDEKEKEREVTVPPLPQKKRCHVASSKQEKEVENLTEKQRTIVEQSGAGVMHKPRIAKLKALFERSPAARESRSGAEIRESGVVETNANIPFLRVPVIKPSLPVKRSKSLKVLGSHQRSKLSLVTTVSAITPLSAASKGESATSPKPYIPPKKYVNKEVNVTESTSDSSRSYKQDGNDVSNYTVLRRRRSLESLPDDARKVIQDCSDYLVNIVTCDGPRQVQGCEASDHLTLEAQRKVNSIVAGLGVRERRNSFRQAVGTCREREVKSSRKMKDYEAIWPDGKVAVPQTESEPTPIKGKSSVGWFQTRQQKTAICGAGEATNGVTSTPDVRLGKLLSRSKTFTSDRRRGHHFQGDSSVDFNGRKGGNVSQLTSPVPKSFTPWPRKSKSSHPVQDSSFYSGIRKEASYKSSPTSQVSYGLVAGVQLRRGSQDDLALCPSPSTPSSVGPSAPARVRRHASVVLLRRSVAENGGVNQTNSGSSQPPLAVWNCSQGNGDTSHHQALRVHGQEDVDKSWMQAPGVDVDTVAASINTRHGDPQNLARTLEGLHIRKSPSSPNSFTNHHLPQSTTLVKKQHYF